MTKGDELRALLLRLPKDQAAYTAVATRGGWKKGSGSSVQRYFHPDFDGDVHGEVAKKLCKALVGLGNPSITTKEVRDIFDGKKGEQCPPDNDILMSPSPAYGVVNEAINGGDEGMSASEIYNVAVSALVKLTPQLREKAFFDAIERATTTGGTAKAVSGRP